MAEKRMFTKKITESDAFLEMPMSTQALYFHLNMNADDDGFVNNPKKIARMVGGSEDDLKILIAKRFILIFETGVIVIKHWRMHNCLDSYHYKPTQYQDEFNSIHLKENRSYTEGSLLIDSNETQKSLPIDSSIDKYSLDKSSIDKSSIKRFKKPTIAEIEAYKNEKGLTLDAEYFWNYYESKGWLVGKTHMKDWKATARNWSKKDDTKRNSTSINTNEQRLSELFGED